MLRILALIGKSQDGEESTACPEMSKSAIGCLGLSGRQKSSSSWSVREPIGLWLDSAVVGVVISAALSLDKPLSRNLFPTLILKKC
jgi:hypothetical protein